MGNFIHLTMKYNVEIAFESQCQHGEGPLWSPRAQSLYWVDLLQGKYFKGNGKGEFTEHALGQPLGVLAERENGGLVMAVRGGFGLTSPGGSSFVELQPAPEAHNKKVRFNDGAVGPGGWFFAGTMEWEGKQPIGKLYRLNPDHSFTEMDNGFYIPNGMAWSNDGKTLYLIDTLQHLIFSYDYEAETGGMFNKQTFVKFDNDEFPDGMTMDSAGHFWIALWEGGKIIHLDEKGRKMEEIPLPVPYPTSCCFGGNDLKTLYISSSRIAMNEKQIREFPLSGNTFYIETDVTGKSEFLFGG